MAKTSEIKSTKAVSESGTRRPRVLVVDDERGARMALEVPLRLSGFNVTAVSNAQSAIELGEKEFFDVLLTDVYMPGISGLKLVREFRRLSPKTRIIVMTAQGSLATAMQAIEHGAMDFIAKPFDIEEVLLLVKRATVSRRRKLSGKKMTFQVQASSVTARKWRTFIN
jgi:DNA-binding NtrC family response regulator